MTAAKAKTSPLLGSQGWDEAVDSRLIRASQQWDEAAEFRTHGHVLRRLFEDVKIDAVLCVEGRPTVCVKDARTLSSEDVESIRHQLWNLSAVTMLVAEGSQDTRVFSTLTKPASNDPHGTKAQIDAETIDLLGLAALALRLRQFIHRVETGAIYRDNESLFVADGAVDQNLLDNLKEARNLMCKVRSRESYQRAHAIIGRFLFSCYLLDRRIIGPAYLSKSKLPEADDMLTLLSNATVNGSRSLTVLFKALQRDFNGSLFGNMADNEVISDEEVKIMLRFLAGENLRTGQLSLFKLYDFEFIPVELISSIYEEFLGAEAAIEEGSSQRVHGAYYTPPRLAELAVDVATEGWSTLLDKRCLDPACGSGVFLVILFIRMAEEWRKRHPQAGTRERYDELMRLLSENLRGIDIHQTACLVTCFSLYLAFLDQMDPKEVIDLQEALERDTKQKILPRILWQRDQALPKPPDLATVREIDFFALPIDKEFDLVIGNPPWVSRKDMATAESWLLSASADRFAVAIRASDRLKTLFPAKELACAFMWKAGLHLLAEGRVCQVLPSRVFLSNNTDHFQNAWLKHHRIESIWLLADWRFVLFPNANAPCFIGRYRPRLEGEEAGSFDFVTPKVELLDPRDALIPVLPEDQKTLSETDIMLAAQRGEAAAAWKKQHWGTTRDARLVDRLMQMPKLKRLAHSPPKNDVIPQNRNRYWFKGQGFQPATSSTTKAHKVFWHADDLFLSASAEVLDLHLLKDNCVPIGDLYRKEGLHRKRSPLLYRGPLLLVNKACTKFLFSEFDVLFQDDFQSICAPKEEEDELLFLVAALSSDLARYLLFHTTANLGIEREDVRLEELLELPFPLPEDTFDPKRSAEILLACARRLRELRKALENPDNFLQATSLVDAARCELNDYIYEYFEVCEWEKLLIQDTVEIFYPSSTPTSLKSDKLFTAKKSTVEHRQNYAKLLVHTFRNWSGTKGHLWAQGSVADKLGLAVLTFGVDSKAKEYSESSLPDYVLEILQSIRKSTAQDGVVFSRLRGFALYESDRVHIIKPLNRRHWTNTAALNDADEILNRMMEESGWRA